MKTRYFIAAAFFAMLILNSCVDDLFCTRGNGLSQTLVRRTASFNSIENTTSIDVVYKKADTTGITITADENLIEDITTETSNNKLVIKTRGNRCLDFNTRPLITISSPSIQTVIASGSATFIADEISGNTITLKLTGSGDISVAAITATDLKVSLSGSGNIRSNDCLSVNSEVFLSGSGEISMAGQSENSNLKLSGSGKIRSENWTHGSADVTITGSGDVFAFVENSLIAFISGSGNIYLKGNPTINKTITGSGRIINY
jgi:hypothetical protein